MSEVAEQTRISPMYIECIEKNSYKPLPGGIFNKGFVRSYARYIGFDEQEALADYARIVAQNETSELGQMPAYKPEVLTDDRTRQSTLPTIAFAGIILALMTGGILILVNYVQNQPSQPAANANTSVPGANTVTNLPGANTAPAGTAPSMAAIKIEFRSTTDPISLSATSDGKTSINTVTPGSSVQFEPKESLRLSYSKSLSASAELFINGKQITLPEQPENPKRAAIEIEINKDNLEKIWNSGQFTYAGAEPEASPAATVPANTTPTGPSPEPSAAVPNPSATPKATASPRITPRPSPTSTVKGTPTPLIVGRSPNANAARSPRPAPRTTPN